MNKAPYYPFSNFLPYTHNPVYEELELVIKTPEHYYQCEKAIHIDDKRRILECEIPDKAKRLGSKIPLRTDWEYVKMRVMYRAQMSKALHNERYAKLILGSTPEDFIEYNHWHDNEWGSCICDKCIVKKKKNLLQQVLIVIQNNLKG